MRQKRDILFLGQYFYPENNSSATLPADTARYLAQHGFTVDALVGYPGEYCKEKDIPRKETVDGVNIRRIRYLRMNRTTRIGRLINYFSFILSAMLHVFRLRNYKSVIVYSNPPLLPLVAIVGNILFGTKIVFVAYDIYPEIAYASGNIRPGSIMDKTMKWLNRLLYRRVSKVVALTEEMKQFLLKNRPEITEDRIDVIANWAHEKTCLADEGAFQTFGYENETFVVSYFGNLGICQDIESILGAADILKDEQNIRFLIVGHGSKMDYVADRCREGQLENVQLLGFLTGARFEQAVAISACCIVSMEKGLKGMCAPSKFYSYLQGGKPVLAVVEEGSYLQEEVTEAQIGKAVRSGDAAGLAAAIRELAWDRKTCCEMGQRAQTLYAAQYAIEIGLGKYAEAFTNLIKQDGV